MATYYPCNQTAAGMCRLCNTSQSGASSCCTSSSSKNSGGTQAWACSRFCNSGCNSNCQSAQTICKVNSQYIKDHADVGSYPGNTISKDDFIHLNWTTSFWNSLIGKLNTAENVGKDSSQGSGGSVTAPISSGAAISANLYNQVRNKIVNFNTSYPGVTNNQTSDSSIISAAVANAMKTAYESAKFDSGVCDVCNSGDQSIHGGCDCNCSCDCSCSCGCSCGPCSCSCGPCSCSCGPCDCSCGPCSCSCGCSCPSPKP